MIWLHLVQMRTILRCFGTSLCVSQPSLPPHPHFHPELFPPHMHTHRHTTPMPRRIAPCIHSHGGSHGDRGTAVDEVSAVPLTNRLAKASVMPRNGYLLR